MTALLARFGSWFARLKPSPALPVRVGAVEVSRIQSGPVRPAGYDQTLMWVTVALLALGLVMVYSASIAMPDNPKFARYAHTHFFWRHMLSLVLAFALSLIHI